MGDGKAPNLLGAIMLGALLLSPLLASLPVIRLGELRIANGLVVQVPDNNSFGLEKIAPTAFDEVLAESEQLS